MSGIDDRIQGIEPLPLQPRLPRRIQEIHEGTLREHGSASDASSAGPNFAEMLREGLQSVSDAGMESEKKLKGLVTGETKSVHEVMAAMGRSEVQFSLMLQVRNKLLEAWQQIQQIRV